MRLYGSINHTVKSAVIFFHMLYTVCRKYRSNMSLSFCSYCVTEDEICVTLLKDSGSERFISDDFDEKSENGIDKFIYGFTFTIYKFVYFIN